MMVYIEKFNEIKEKCLRSTDADIRSVISMLNKQVDLPTTRAVDFYLSLVNKPEGIKVLEEFLFEGSQMQRNYCTLYFARKDEWALVNKAFKLGLIDSKQAYSR